MTGNEDGYQLLLFNEKHFNPRYSVDELFMRNRSKELHVRLLGMAPENTKSANTNSTRTTAGFIRNGGN